MTTAYLWLKALHIIGVVCWFAAMFYLPRLFVYHSSTEDDSRQGAIPIMEDKLYRVIMRPSMIITLCSVSGSVSRLGSLRQQRVAVDQTGWRRSAPRLPSLLRQAGTRFRRGPEPHSERFYRIFNEGAALLLILIVILVVVKPF